MKNLILVLIAFTLFSCQGEMQKPVENFEVFRGTNVAHWLSQSGKRGMERQEFFIREDVENISEMGFDHIRLPIDEEQMWDEEGNRHDDAFELMTNCVKWCEEFDLRIIMDLHILRSHHFNADDKPLWTDSAEREKFIDLWRDLSNALIEFPTSLVAYELMNEAVADDPDQWNELVEKTVSALRKIEPKRTIVIGSNRWQSYDTFDVLKVPDNDSNILLSFHFYEPFLLTHYHASWTGLKNYQGPVHYPGVILTGDEFEKLDEEIQPVVENWVGREFNKEIINEMWQEPIQKAKELGMPLYCGEFGIITGPPEEDRLNWYRDMIDLFEENGIGYANWNYKSGSFGLLSGDEERNEELIQIVSGNE